MSVDIFGYCDPSVTHVSIPETLIPEGNKSRVSGDGLESIRPATNFPRIPVDSNQVDRLAAKIDLALKLAENFLYPRWNYISVRSKTGVL